MFRFYRFNYEDLDAYLCGGFLVLFFFLFLDFNLQKKSQMKKGNL